MMIMERKIEYFDKDFPSIIN